MENKELNINVENKENDLNNLTDEQKKLVAYCMFCDTKYNVKNGKVFFLDEGEFKELTMDIKEEREPYVKIFFEYEKNELVKEMMKKYEFWDGVGCEFVIDVCNLPSVLVRACEFYTDELRRYSNKNKLINFFNDLVEETIGKEKFIDYLVENDMIDYLAEKMEIDVYEYEVFGERIFIYV
mgnify:CR=1 FL=1